MRKWVRLVFLCILISLLSPCCSAGKPRKANNKRDTRNYKANNKEDTDGHITKKSKISFYYEKKEYSEKEKDNLLREILW